MEVIERAIEIAFRHQRVAVVHQTASIARTLDCDIAPKRSFRLPNFVALKCGVAAGTQDEENHEWKRQFREWKLRDWSLEEKRKRAGERNHKSDVRKKSAVIVHDFGEREERRRQERDQKPKQTETDDPSAFEANA